MAHLSLLVLTFVLAFVQGGLVQKDWQNPPESGTTIRDTILKEKFEFLQNLLQKYNVDVDAIRAKFLAAKGEDLEGPKRQVRDVSAQPVEPSTIRDTILKEKFDFLQNLLQKYNVDVDAIRAKFLVAKGEDLEGPKRQARDVSGQTVEPSTIRDTILKEKFDFLQNLLLKYNVDLEAIKAKFLAANGEGSKRQVRDVSAQPVEPSAIRDTILKEKFDFLQNLLQKYNVDLEAIKVKFLAARSESSKRQVRDVSVQTNNPPVDPLVGIADGILGAIASTLKSLVDSLLLTFNASSGGTFRNLLVTIQAIAYDLIDKRFPSNSTSYTSNLNYSL